MQCPLYFFILSTYRGKASSCDLFPLKPMSLIWIFAGVVLSCDGAMQMWGKETKSDSPPHREDSDFWPYLGLLLWLSYPWSYLKEDEIWQVLGLAKAASWLHSIPPVGNPSQNIVSTFKSVWFIAVPCTSPLTCTASWHVDRRSWTFVFFWPAFLLGMSPSSNLSAWGPCEPDSSPPFSIQG